MGNYVFDAKALIDAVTADVEERRRRATTSAATSSRCWSSAGEAQVFDFASTDVPGRVRARARLLARHRDARRLLRRAHGPDLARPDLQPLQRASWPILKQPDRLPPAKFVFEEPGRTGMAVDSMVCAGVIVSGGVVRRSVLSPGVHVHSGAEVEGSVLMHGVDIGDGAIVKQRDRRQERAWSSRAPGSASTSSATASGSSSRRAASSSSARASVSVSDVRVALLTREYPPDVYGGAGVHVEYLARELARLVDVTVHCWGAPRPADWRPPVVAYRALGRARGQRAASGGAARGLDRPGDGGRGRGRRRSSTATPGTRTSAGTWRS